MRIGNSLITIELIWTEFLKYADGTYKGLYIQHEETNQQYLIFALDQSILYLCYIFQAGNEPGGWTAQEISDNTTYRTDFEANWKSNSNSQLNIKTQNIGAPIGPQNRKGLIIGRVATAAVTTVPIRATTYVEPAAAAQRSLVSSNVNDITGGTGARLVRIIYFDNLGAGPFIENVTMNGTTFVNTAASNIRFIQKIEVINVGSNDSNVGIISLRDAGGGGPTYGSIAAGDNVTFWAHHFVRAGRVTVLNCVSASVRGAVAGNIIGRYRPLGPVSVDRQVTDTLRLMSGSGTIVRESHIPIQLIGPGRLTYYVTPDATTAGTWFVCFEFSEDYTP
jgi:hypothetical protein